VVLSEWRQRVKGDRQLRVGLGVIQTSGVLGVLAITHSSTATTPPTFEVLTLILLILPESLTHYLHTQNTYMVVVTYPKHYGGNCMCNG
jgi:hypothetical protein